MPNERGVMDCLVGQYRIHREVINDGIRFTAPSCPNALQWTITSSRLRRGYVRIHCTINQFEQQPEYVEFLQKFVDDWADSLGRGKQPRVPLQSDAGKTVCENWYG